MNRDNRHITFGELCLWIFITCCALLVLGILPGCATTQPGLSTSVVYRYDMAIEIGGYGYDGTAVVPHASKYHIKVTSKQDMDLLTITTCSRETPVSDAIKQGWFSTKRGYEFDFSPNSIEAQGGCPLLLGGYDKSTGRHSWGYIDFQGDEKLAAGVTCNGGSEYGATGVGICQSHTGLMQKIRFTKPVDIAIASQVPACRLPIPADGKNFEFTMPKGVCTSAFMDRATGDVFRLTTIGYDQIVIRSN